MTKAIGPKLDYSLPPKPVDIDPVSVPEGNRNLLKSRISAFGKDLNPANVLVAPDIHSGLIDQINRSTPDPDRVEEFTQEVTDKIAEKFTNNAHIYMTTYWIFEVIFKKKNLGESVYIEIVKEATTVDPQTGQSPGFWKTWSILRKRLTLFESVTGFFFYLTGNAVIKDFVKQVVENITTEMRNNFSKKESLASVLNNIIKKFHSFFTDYYKTMQKYAKGADPSIHGTAEDFLQKEIQTGTFIRDADQNPFSEKEMYTKFCKVVAKKIVPRFHPASSYWNFINPLNAKSAGAKLGKGVFMFATIWFHIPSLILLSFTQITANRILDLVLTGSSLLKTEGKLPLLMKYSMEIGTQQLEGNAYTYALNTFLCDQVKELRKQMASGEVSLPSQTFISDSSRKELKGLVGMLIKVLDLQNAKGSQEELRAAFENGWFFQKENWFFPNRINGAIEESLEEGLIFLCNYLTQEGKIEELLFLLMNVANSPFEENNFSSDIERQIAYRQKQEEVHQVMRDLLKEQVQEAVRGQLSGKSTKVEQQVVNAFYNQFKKKSLPQVEKIQASLEDLSSSEMSDHSREIAKTAMQQVSFHASLMEVEAQEMLKNLENNYPASLKEVKKRFNSIVKLQGQIIEILRRIKKFHALVLDRKNIVAVWNKTALCLQYVLKWSNTNLAAAAFQPKQIQEALQQLGAQDGVDLSILNKQNETLQTHLKRAEKLSSDHSRIKALTKPGGLILKLQELKEKEIETKRSKQDSIQLLMEAISKSIGTLDIKLQSKMKSAIDRIHLTKTKDQLESARGNYKISSEEVLLAIDSLAQKEQKQIQETAQTMLNSVEKEKKDFEISQEKVLKNFETDSARASILAQNMHKEISSLRSNPIFETSYLGLLAAASPLILPAAASKLSYIGSLGFLPSITSYLPSLPSMENITEMAASIPYSCEVLDVAKSAIKAIPYVDRITNHTFIQSIPGLYNTDHYQGTVLRALTAYAGGAFLAKPFSKMLYGSIDQISNNWVFPQVWKRFNSAYEFAQDKIVFRGLANSFGSLVVDLNQD